MNRSLRRVLLVTNIFPPQIGGPATFMDLLAHHLSDDGWRVTLVCCSDRSRDPADHGRPFRVVRVAGGNIVAQQALIPLALARELARHRTIFVNGLEYQTFLASRALGRRYVLKIVGDSAWERARNLGVTAASLDEFQPVAASVPQVRGIVSRRTSVLQRARVIVTPSEYLRSIVIGWGVAPDRVVTIPNGVTLAAAPPRSPGGGDLRVTFCGRLTNWKGVETLLLAMQGLPGVRATVVGDGPELPMLLGLARQLQVTDTVSFAGRQSPDAVRRTMAASDVLVLVSQYEGLSHTILEAAASGLPCIASAVGGNPEVVRDGETGVLLPYGDVQALRLALIRLRDAPGLAASLGAAAQRRALEFDFRETAGRIAGWLE